MEFLKGRLLQNPALVAVVEMADDVRMITETIANGFVKIYSPFLCEPPDFL